MGKPADQNWSSQFLRMRGLNPKELDEEAAEQAVLFLERPCSGKRE
jgi:hypothetical protein